jgi:hypothetical protein
MKGASSMWSGSISGIQFIACELELEDPTEVPGPLRFP